MILPEEMLMEAGSWKIRATCDENGWVQYFIMDDFLNFFLIKESRGFQSELKQALSEFYVREKIRLIRPNGKIIDATKVSSNV